MIFNNDFSFGDLHCFPFRAKSIQMIPLTLIKIWEYLKRNNEFATNAIFKICFKKRNYNFASFLHLLLIIRTNHNKISINKKLLQAVLLLSIMKKKSISKVEQMTLMHLKKMNKYYLYENIPKYATIYYYKKIFA